MRELKDKVDFILDEERDILGMVLDLKIPFTVEKSETHPNQTWYRFSKSAKGKDEEPNEFSFVIFSTNGMVNSDFDLDYLDDIVKWRNGEEFSKVFRMWLGEKKSK